MATLHPVCPQCKTQMEEGCTIDKNSLEKLLRNDWNETRSERSFWLGLKISSREHQNVKTFRCEDCDYCESYAW